MTRFDATGLSTALAALALTSGAAAQSGFRPLPHLPRLDPWLLSVGGAASPLLDEAPPAPSTTLDARLFFSAHAEGDLENGGAVATQRGGWAATFGQRFGDQRTAALELSAEAHFYDLQGATTLVPGNSEPFNDLYRAGLSGQLRTDVDRRIAYFVGFELELAGEDDASFTDSLSVGAAGGVTISSRERLKLSLGLAALSQLEDDPWIWPWLGFEWRASERLELSAHGTDLEARLQLSESLDCVARIDYTLRQFRLSEDGPAAGGALRDEDIRAGLGLEWQIDEGVALSVSGGFSAWRELTVFDKSGHATEDEIDPSPFVAFSLSLGL